MHCLLMRTTFYVIMSTVSKAFELVNEALELRKEVENE